MMHSTTSKNDHRVRRGWFLLLIPLSLAVLWTRMISFGSAGLIIQTVAGTGEPGFSGDGGPAVEAQLNSPAAVAVSAGGILYIADVRNHRIRRVDSSGVIKTVAGNGTPGLSGDGRPAIDAQLNQPLGIAIDDSGIFIADTLNNRIRKVNAAGMISTVAGNGMEGFAGDGEPAVDAMLSRPVGLTLDANGNLYIADVFNHRIRKVDTEGKISTVAGNGMAGFSGDGGLAVEAQLARPRDVAVDAEGNLYIADTDNLRIRRASRNGIISTVAGNGEAGFNGDGIPALEASLSFPRSVAVDGLGRLIIADMGNYRIRQVSIDRIISTIVGNGEPGFGGDGGPATEVSLGAPRGVRVDGSGAIYFADLDNHRVRAAR
ncbi:MAG: hypothetical protein HY314_14650 [Acidobacteria bacterium]|nr:hypothetical protein [Acidobacteriota bacterium]